MQPMQPVAEYTFLDGAPDTMSMQGWKSEAVLCYVCWLACPGVWQSRCSQLVVGTLPALLLC
jgi:hypothetical protein